MRILRVTLILAIALCTSCASFRAKPPSTAGAPENAAPYGYHPIDPLPVAVRYPAANPAPTAAQLLAILPDETMRIAIGQIQGSGNVTFGPAKTGIAGNSYVVILDYIKFQTQSFPVELTGSANSPLVVTLSLSPQPVKARSQPQQSSQPQPAPVQPQPEPLVLTQSPPTKTIVPVYIGVGLRMTANVTVNEGSVDLGNLFAVGVAAQAKKVTGTLVVQTLGVSGQSISTLIPMPGEINPTTIQNAILALGAIKAKLYDQGTAITPRVVGVYNNLGGGQATINSFISTLLLNPQSVTLP